jgi:DedD protein
MEERLKQRLTGAAILVALIVLIVPELFHGHLADRGGKAVSSSEGPPMRSYLIDLDAGHSAPMQLGASSARGLAASPAVSAPSAPAEPVASTAAARPVAPSAAAPTSGSQSAPVAALPPAPKSIGPAAHHGSAPAHASVAAKAAAPIVQVKAVAPGSSSATHGKAAADWSVQLGLYAKRVNAERMVRVAHTKGFSASFAKPDAKGRYRVQAAGLTTRSAAMTLAARLRAAGLPAAAVGPR